MCTRALLSCFGIQAWRRAVRQWRVDLLVLLNFSDASTAEVTGSPDSLPKAIAQLCLYECNCLIKNVGDAWYMVRSWDSHFNLRDLGVIHHEKTDIITSHIHSKHCPNRDHANGKLTLSGGHNLLGLCSFNWQKNQSEAINNIHNGS